MSNRVMLKRVVLNRVLLSSLLATASVAAFAANQKYDVDGGHTQVTITWNHFGFSNPSATFEKINGSLQLDSADLTKSSVNIDIPLSSVHTGVPKLDEHLQSPDFFDVAKFPNATFKSTKVEKAGDNKLKVTGDLTIHGVTKQKTLAVKVNKIGEFEMMKTQAAGFDADITLKRSEFGIDKYIPNVSDEIPVHITFAANLAK